MEKLKPIKGDSIAERDRKDREVAERTTKIEIKQTNQTKDGAKRKWIATLLVENKSLFQWFQEDTLAECLISVAEFFKKHQIDK